MQRASLIALFLSVPLWLTQPTAAQQAEPQAAPPDTPPPAAPDTTQPPPPNAPPPTYVAPSLEEYSSAGGREFIYYPGPDPMRPHNEAELIIGVPLWFTSEDGVVGPGVGFEARFARRIGAVAPEFTFGWQINWLDEDKLPHNADVSIDTFYFSLGMRIYPIPQARVVMPFISGAVDFDFWHISGNEDLVCGWYYCTTVAEYDFTFGLSSRLGVAFLVSPEMQLEVGAKVSMAFPMGPIDDTEGWVTPFIGFAALF
ncbi:MAG TPA: hypothetical protein VJV78_24210 [Polyangiales bacterium]|nr:hypothetical protein [Polyangiales bacterium]